MEESCPSKLEKASKQMTQLCQTSTCRDDASMTRQNLTEKHPMDNIITWRQTLEYIQIRECEKVTIETTMKQVRLDIRVVLRVPRTSL